MKSLIADFGEGSHFVTLCRRMIDFQKLRGPKFPVQFQTQWIKTGPDYDELFGSMNKRRPGKLGDIFLSQSVMQQNSRDRDALDQLRDRSNPWPARDLQKQACPYRIGFEQSGAQICRSLRDSSRIFRVVTEKDQARSDQQSGATGLSGLHSPNSKIILPLRLLCAACATAALASSIR